MTRLGIVGGIGPESTVGRSSRCRGRFYHGVFSRSHIELVCPRDDERAYIHAVYVEKLLKNVFRPETRERLLAIVELMKDRELPLLLTSETTSPLPLLDTTQIHVMAAINELLG
jgi:aspartate racemase